MRRATIVGAGVFGAWTAAELLRRGWAVTLIEQHGPGNSRGSSGGETRITRSGYGRLALYARWARESLPAWRALEARSGERLFVPTGALFTASEPQWLSDTADVLDDLGIPCQRLSPAALATRYPQLHFPGAGAVFEPEAGVLFARRAVQTLVRTLVADGVRLVHERADPRRLLESREADAIVFAAGPWLPSLFPDLLGDVIQPTRQEVLFFGAPPGDGEYTPAKLPAWVAFDEGIYGLPDLEHRGVKIAIDAHGPAANPESMDRGVSQQAIQSIRERIALRIPRLADAPLLEARVCQYENTPDGHLLLDRLPGHDRAWIAGGGSGHGFKHGPAVGRYVADLMEGNGVPEPSVALAGRPPRVRAVY